MGFWGDALRVGGGVFTLGGSELARQAVGEQKFDKAADDAKTWLLGGGATKGMASEPQTAGFQRGYLQNDFLNRQAPMMNTGQADQTRGQQGQLASMLFQQAQGMRPGAGEMAVNRQANQALAAQTSAAQMARGANAALAMRNAARTRADIGVNAAGQASIAQLQDQQSAQNQLGGLLGGMRGQDLQTAGANQQAQMQQQQLQLAALAQMLGVDQAALQQDLAKRGIAANDKGMLPTLLQVGGSIAGAAAGSPGAGAAVGGAVGRAIPAPSPSDSYILGPKPY